MCDMIMLIIPMSLVVVLSSIFTLESLELFQTHLGIKTKTKWIVNRTNHSAALGVPAPGMPTSFGNLVNQEGTTISPVPSCRSSISLGLRCKWGLRGASSLSPLLAFWEEADGCGGWLEYEVFGGLLRGAPTAGIPWEDEAEEVGCDGSLLGKVFAWPLPFWALFRMISLKLGVGLCSEILGDRRSIWDDS